MLVQLLVHVFDVDVLVNLHDVLLDAILRFDVSDVLLLVLVLLLLLLLGDCRCRIHDVDVHVVNLDVPVDVDNSMLDVHPILGTSLCS